MSVIVELSTTTEDCPLDALFDAASDARIVFEPLVQQTKGDVQSFWVYNVPRALVSEVCNADEDIRRVRVHGDHDRDEAEERGDTQSERTPVLVEVTWAEEAEPSFLELVGEHEAAILAQTGTARGWAFTLRFADRQSTAAFQAACREADIPITISRVQESDRAGGSVDELTAPQREVYTTALERGYFEIPRRATLVDLGEEFGITDQAVSERLRRAQTNLGRHVTSSNGNGNGAGTDPETVKL